LALVIVVDVALRGPKRIPMKLLSDTEYYVQLVGEHGIMPTMKGKH
jgi:hypothetical protein